LIPILQPEYVTNRIVQGIKRRDKQLLLPSFGYVTFLFRFLAPVWLMDKTADWLGFNNGMDSFRGRNFDKKNE
jgi:hypothetical protein